MSRLEELIGELCPDGVEYKSVGDISTTLVPTIKVKSNDYLLTGKYPIIDQGQDYIGGYTNYEGAFQKGEYIIFGDHTCIIKYVDFSFVQGADGVKVIVANLGILPKYLYYAMSNIKMDAGYKRHWSKMKCEQIPVPPLEVQNEIVRILDNFTELTAELTAELKARKQQYEYYRNNLLSFGIEVKYKPIRVLYKRLKGTSITAGKMKEINDLDGEIRVFAGGKTVINAKESDIPNANITKVPAVIVQSRGIIDVIYYDKPFTFKNEMWAYTADNAISVKFLYYILKNNIQKFRDTAEGMGSMPQISLPVTDEFMIPVLPLEKQIEIVQILDYFEGLCNNISSGLPAEIEARQKQYEYYRDKLLSFKEYTG